jgi:predicted Zn-dependent protease
VLAPTAQQVVERALEVSTSDAAIAIVRESTGANLRWANNTLTTNGVMRRRTLTAISFSGGAGAAPSTGSVTGSAASWDQVAAIVAAADATARASTPAEDASDLVGGGVADDWPVEPGETSIDVFATFAPELGEAFARASSSDRILYGFVDHDVTTTYLGSSTGLRLRHEQPTGHYGMTGKSSDLTRSAWVGGATRDFADVDALALDDRVAERLAWAERRVDLPAGRYDTVLPPTAVADLMIYAYWSASAREALEGQTVFSRPHGGTRIGERLSRRPVQMFSDPAYSGLQAAPFVVASASGNDSSVFDNGLTLARTDWVKDGRLAALLETRHSARLAAGSPGHGAGVAAAEAPATPAIDNLVVSVDGAEESLDDLVAGVDRGLLLTCLWYIRVVDPVTLLLTGLTRDGVYLVEKGEITGAVNNFRYNESPVALLDRFTAASVTEPSFSREWGDYFPRTATPALRVPDFNMSSVSQAQ